MDREVPKQTCSTPHKKPECLHKKKGEQQMPDQPKAALSTDEL